MKIGVVSDTHGYLDPRLHEVLEGVDVILHAGDVDSPDILEELKKIALVHAVRGNVDGTDLDLPLTHTLQLAGVQVEMQHILPSLQSEVEAWSKGALRGQPFHKRGHNFLKNFDEATRVVIFGHSHEPCLLNMSQVLFFNPGSAGKRRFSLPRCCGLLEITSKEIKGMIVDLEDGEKNLPAAVVMPVKE
jgi:putative phosphoesterase